MGETAKRPLTMVFVETTDVSVSSHLAGQLGFLRARGHDVTVVARETGSLYAVAAADGVRAVSLPMVRNPSPLRDLRCLMRLFLLLRSMNPDIVVYGTPKAGLLSAIAARAARVPARVYFLYGLRSETMTSGAAKAMFGAETIVSRLSTRVIAVGAELRDRAAALGMTDKRIDVVGAGSANGVDVAKFHRAADDTATAFRDSHGISRESRVVGFVGRVTADKGIDALVDAVRVVRKSVPDVHLVVVGPDDGLDGMSRRTISAFDEPWATRVPGVDDTSDVYPALDVFCLPSRREGLPTVVLEAAAASVPIAATAATGMRDILDHGRSALISEIDDVPQLARNIALLLSDHELAAEFAAAAATRVATDFDQPTVWRQLAEFYESAADAQRIHLEVAP